MEATGPAVPVELVHALRPEGEWLTQVGLGVLAHQVAMPDLSMPPMVVLLMDRHSVAEDQRGGHDRQSVLDGEEVSFVCALDWEEAQKLSELAGRAAESVDRHEGSLRVPAFVAKPLRAYLPDRMEWTSVGITVRPVESAGATHALAATLVLGNALEHTVAGMGAPAARTLAGFLARYAAKVRVAGRARRVQ